LVSSASIKKMGEMRICSLWRKFVEMAEISNKTTPPGRRLPDSRGYTRLFYRPDGRFHHAKYTHEKQDKIG
jgi:hypothetical protein